MIRRYKVCLMVVTLGVLLAGSARAEVDPDKPIEYVPFQPSTLVEPIVSVQVAHIPGSGLFTYRYMVRSGPGSRQPLIAFRVGTSPFGSGTSLPIVEHTEPPGWVGFEHNIPNDWAPDDMLICPDFVRGALKGGEALPGPLLFKTAGLPSIGLTYTRGDVVPPSGQQVMLPPPDGYSARVDDDSVKNTTVVPQPPPTPFTGATYLSFLQSQLGQAVGLGWVARQNRFDPLLQTASTRLKQGDPSGAVSTLQVLLAALDQERGSAALKDEGFFLMRPNVEFLIELIPGLA